MGPLLYLVGRLMAAGWGVVSAALAMHAIYDYAQKYQPTAQPHQPTASFLGYLPNQKSCNLTGVGGLPICGNPAFGDTCVSHWPLLSYDGPTPCISYNEKMHIADPMAQMLYNQCAAPWGTGANTWCQYLKDPS